MPIGAVDVRLVCCALGELQINKRDGDKCIHVPTPAQAPIPREPVSGLRVLVAGANWKFGYSLPDTAMCATLARLTGLPLARVLGIV